MSGQVSGFVEKRMRSVVTPEGISLPFTVASRGARVGALVLDLLFVQIALFVIFLLLLWAFTGVFSFADGDTLEEASGPVELIVVTWILISLSLIHI